MNWNDIFDYRDGNLYWKIKPAKCTRIGAKAGCVTTKGYIQIKYDDKTYSAHRIIWEMHYGPIPDGMQIDHIWHDRKDNRIDNLRLVSNAENGRNQSKFTNNTSGVTGVFWYAKNKKWGARIKVDGKTIFLGLYRDIADAAVARKEAEILYNFHTNHGK